MSTEKDYSQKVSVSSVALRELLVALLGPGHLIREIQMLSKAHGSSIAELSKEVNPLDLILQQFNEEVEKFKAEQNGEQPAAPAQPEPPAKESEQPGLPGVSEMYKAQPIFFYDASLQGDCNEHMPGTLAMSPLQFGEHDLSLNGELFAKDGMKERYGWTDDDVYEPTFDIYGFHLALQYGNSTSVVYLPAPGKGTIIESNTDAIGKFKYNKTVEFNGRLFTIEALLGFNPVTAQLRMTAVSVNADCPTRKIGEAWGIKEQIQTVTLLGLSFRVVRMVRQD